MNFLKVTSALAVTLALAAGAAAQSRGNLRIQGKVFDEAGQPVADAQVRAAKPTEAKPEIFSAKTNKKGEYQINGLAPGDWVLEGAKEGLGASEVKATLVDGTRTTTVDIKISKPAPKVDPNAELQAEHQRAIKIAQDGNIPEARKIYDGLIAKYPAVYQLHAMMANMYAVEANPGKALEHVNLALEKEPENVEWKLLKAEMLMEANKKEEASAVLATVDMTKAKESRAFINSAINDINSGKADAAVELLTKVAAQFPSDPTVYYYRGRAYIAAQKLPEAKADLEKFVAAAPPDAPQLADAKRLLDQLNKK